MVMIGFLLIYITIVFGSIFISSILNKKIEKTIAINIGLIILELYIFGIFGILKQGLYAVVIINIILGIIGIIKKKKKIVELVLTPGLAFFTIIYFILIITNFNRRLTHWDQFLYRSVNSKVMFYNDTLFSEYGRIYPPVTSLLEYFFMKLVGTYTQGIEAFAMQIFGISLLLPIFENVRKNKLVMIITGLIVMFIPALFGSMLFYESSYPDATIGLLIGYILYTYFSEKEFKFKIISIMIITAILVLTKPIGIAVSVVLICVFMLYELINNKYYKKENIKKILKNKNFIIILLILFVSLTMYGSYKLVIKTYTTKEVLKTSDRTNGDSVGYVIDSLIATVFGKYQENNDSAISNRNMISAIDSFTGFTYPVKMSLKLSTLIICIAYILYYYKNKDKKEEKDIKSKIISIFVGLILYIIVLQLCYLLKFVTFEMIGHQGLDRYYPAYLLGMIYFIVLVVMDNLNGKKYSSKEYIILFVIIVLFTPMKSITNATITSGIYNIESHQYANLSENIADKIDKYIEDDSKVITVMAIRDDNEIDKIYNLMLRYFLYPNHEVLMMNYMREISTIEKAVNEKEYQYIYIYSKDDELQEAYKKIFTNQFELKNKTLYKIDYTQETVQLIELQYMDEIVK